MQNKTAGTYKITIYIAGDYNQAVQLCRQFTFYHSLCVTVDPTMYVYVGGAESGVKIGLINYPKYATDTDRLYHLGKELAEYLRKGLCQHSYTIERLYGDSDSTSEWFDYKDENAAAR
jgi:hypothetical protein